MNTVAGDFEFRHGPFDDALVRCSAIIRMVPGAKDAFRAVIDAGDAARVEVNPSRTAATIYPSEAFISLVEMFEADQLARISSTESV